MKLLTLAFSLLLATQTLALNKGEIAPNITVKQYSPDGNHFDTNITEAAAGKDFVLVEFFAFWCYYCNQSKPVVKDLTTTFQDKLTVRAVTVEPMDDQEIITNMETLQNEEPLLNIASDTDEMYPSLQAFGIRGFPTFFLLDSNGTVLYKHVGLLTPASAAPFYTILNN